MNKKSLFLSLTCVAVVSGLEDEMWVLYKTREGYKYYFNTETLEGTWDRPDNMNDECAQLKREEIQVW